MLLMALKSWTKLQPLPSGFQRGCRGYCRGFYTEQSTLFNNSPVTGQIPEQPLISVDTNEHLAKVFFHPAESSCLVQSGCDSKTKVYQGWHLKEGQAQPWRVRIKKAEWQQMSLLENLEVQGLLGDIKIFPPLERRKGNLYKLLENLSLIGGQGRRYWMSPLNQS